MEKQLFISQCTEFFNEINYLYENKLNIVFSDNPNDEYFTFEPLKKSINCNIAHLESEQFKEWETHLGNNFFKYIILHEYGHFLFSELITDFFSRANKVQYKLVYNQDFDNFIREIMPNISLISLNFYFGRQKWATGEFMADFFIKEANEKYFLYLDFNKYVEWRKYSTLKNFIQIEEENNFHLNSDHVHYYHLYKALIDHRLEKNKTNYDFLISLSLSYSHNLCVLCMNQVRDSSYNKQQYIDLFFS